MPIFLSGETGTGKSTLAREIHDISSRSKEPFVQINIASFSQNLVESELFGHAKGAFTGALFEKRGIFLEANKGTLFLDEIDSLSFELQTKLLLFLDDLKIRAVGSNHDKKVDVRLIVASGENLEDLIQKRR